MAESFVRTVEKEEQEDAQDLAEKYLTATAGGLTAIFVGLFGKTNGSKLKVLFSRLVGRIRRRED